MKRILLAFVSLSALLACSDPNEGELFVQPTTLESEMSMTTILEQSPDEYSLWLELLRHADFYNALKDANAKATVFCPTNVAVKTFLADRGAEKVTDLDYAYARKLVKNHILNQTIVSDSALILYARNGQPMEVKNLFDKSVTLTFGHTETDVDDEYRTGEIVNADSIYVNNQARIGRFIGTSCSNGQLFAMADVIVPNADNIVEKLEGLKGEGNTFRIFAEAIKADTEMHRLATTESDTAIAIGGQQIVTRHFYTCFATPDNVMQQNGVTDVASLKTWILNNSNGEETDGDVALNHYLKYHFMNVYSRADEVFCFTTDGETLIYDTQYSGQAFICDMIDGKRMLNKDIRLLRSDIEASNGYIMKVGGMMQVYHPTPVNVKWDFLNSADIIAFVNSWSSNNKLGDIFTTAMGTTIRQVDLSDEYREGQHGTLSSFRHKWNESKTGNGSYRHVGFCKDCYVSRPADPEKPQHSAYMNNFVVLNLGFPGWVEFDTPTIVAGKYRIVLHYLNDATFQPFYNAGTLCQFNLDGADHQTMTYLYKGAPSIPRTGQIPAIEETLWPAVEFSRSEPHTFKVTMRDIDAKNSSSYHLWLDYVEFIPVD